MPTGKKGCDNDEIFWLFSPQRQKFRKSKGSVQLHVEVRVYRLMCCLRESAITPTHSSEGEILPFLHTLMLSCTISRHARVPEVYINVYKRSYLTKLLIQRVWGKKLCVYSPSAQNFKVLNDKLTRQVV